MPQKSEDLIRSILEPAVGPERLVRRDDLVGKVPARMVDSLARASKQVTTRAELDEAVARFAVEIDAFRSEQAERDPAVLAQHVRRWS